MQLPQSTQEWWDFIMVWMKFLIRLPLLLLLISGGLMVCFVLFMGMWRLTEFLWNRFLSAPWG